MGASGTSKGWMPRRKAHYLGLTELRWVSPHLRNESAKRLFLCLRPTGSTLSRRLAQKVWVPFSASLWGNEEGDSSKFRPAPFVFGACFLAEPPSARLAVRGVPAVGVFGQEVSGQGVSQASASGAVLNPADAAFPF